MAESPVAENPNEAGTAAGEPAAGAPASRGSLAAIFLIVFIDLLGFGMVLPLLPIYAKSFGVQEHGWEIALLMSSFSAMQFLFAPLWGRLSDRVGRRPILLLGLLGSVVFYGLFGLATAWQSLTWLFVARIGAGISGATIATAQAYIADVTTLQTRAKGMALIGAAFGLGFTFGPLIGAAALFFSASEEAVGTSPWPGYAASALSLFAMVLTAFVLPESLRPGHAVKHHSAFDLGAWRDAFSTATVPALLLTSFVSVVSFGAFETTLSLLLYGTPFGLTLPQVFLFFAFIGFTLTLAQGFLVRRLSGRISETKMALTGCVVTIAGLVLLAMTSQSGSIPWLMLASAVQVTGFSLMTPSLQSLISRRSDPAKQGGILGVSQSTSALARICGPLISVPLFFQEKTLPYWAGVAMMLGAMAVFAVFSRGGKDYSSREGT